MESFKRILIPTDGSEIDKLAVQKGLSLAKLVGAQVTTIYVIDQSAFAAIPPDSLVTDIYNVLKKEAEYAVDTVKKAGEAQGIVVNAIIAEGVPSHEIVDESENHDLIVMSTLGRTGLGRLLMGSVAEKVVRHATCPVMLIRSRAQLLL